MDEDMKDLCLILIMVGILLLAFWKAVDLLVPAVKLFCNS